MKSLSMLRKDYIELLRDNPIPFSSLVKRVGLKSREVADDLEHLKQSLRHQEMRLRVTPAQCRKCNFQFSEHKIGKPSKCPKCKGTWISDPILEITAN